MNNEEIVYKIIKKAQKNGWYTDTEFKVIYYDGSIGSSIFLHGTFNDDGHIETWQRDLETLIYQPYFARAFWGEKPACGNPDCDDCPGIWTHYIQTMVLEEDPIKYLEKFL